MTGHGREQGLGVAVTRVRAHRIGAADLDDHAEVHDGDPVGHVAHDGQVVCDHDVGQAEVALQIRQQVHDLGLDRDVERGDRLVGHDQARLQGEGTCHADALALPARELVREPVRMLRREADHVEQLADTAAYLAARAECVDAQRLANDLAHALSRVQRCVRILEDHLHLAPVRPQLRAARAR